MSCNCLFPTGLGGELRGGKRLDDRIREAQKMGFKRIIVPKAGATSQFKSKRTGSATSATMGQKEGVVECRTLYDALAVGFVNPEVSKSLKGHHKKRSSSAVARNVNSMSSYKREYNDEDNSYATEEMQDDQDSDYS